MPERVGSFHNLEGKEDWSKEDWQAYRGLMDKLSKLTSNRPNGGITSRVTGEHSSRGINSPQWIHPSRTNVSPEIKEQVRADNANLKDALLTLKADTTDEFLLDIINQKLDVLQEILAEGVGSLNTPEEEYLPEDEYIPEEEVTPKTFTALQLNHKTDDELNALLLDVLEKFENGTTEEIDIKTKFFSKMEKSQLQVERVLVELLKDEEEGSERTHMLELWLQDVRDTSSRLPYYTGNNWLGLDLTI